MDKKDKSDIKGKFDDTKKFLKNKNKHQVRCMQAQVKFMVGMLCAACNPNVDFVDEDEEEGETTTVEISDDSCDKLEEKCSDFLDDSSETQQVLQDLDCYIKKKKDKNATCGGDISEIEGVEEIISDPIAVCLTGDEEDKRKFICEEMTSSGGYSVDPEILEEPCSSSGGRRLSTSISYSVTSNGYDAYNVGDNSYVDSTVEVDGVNSDDLEDEDFGKVLGGFLLMVGILI